MMVGGHRRQPCLPPLGRIVLYLPYGRRAPVPAIVMGTLESLHLDDLATGEVPPLSGSGHMHLAVIGAASQHQTLGVASAEYDVLEDDHFYANGEDAGHYIAAEQTPGTWRWPILR